MSVIDQLLVLPQRVLPQRGLSLLVRWLTRQEVPLLTPAAIRAFSNIYGVALEEAERSDPADYLSFNDFFTRALRVGARPLDAAAVLSPADGKISQLGRITAGELLQAKGRHFSLEALLAGDEVLARTLEGGHYAVVYLSPRDYHRVHAALDCSTRQVCFVPGQRYSVNDRTARVVDGLYARNERVVLSGESAYGPCALVMVGAMMVSSMSLAGFDLAALERGARAPRLQTLAVPLRHQQGDEVGRFNMGSTVVLLLPPSAPAWDPALSPGSPVRMGQRLSVS